MDNNGIDITERRVIRELAVHGITSERVERELVIQKGHGVGCVIRCFFKQEAANALVFGQKIINALTGFGSVIQRLGNADYEDETVIEVSFKF